MVYSTPSNFCFLPADLRARRRAAAARASAGNHQRPPTRHCRPIATPGQCLLGAGEHLDAAVGEVALLEHLEIQRREDRQVTPRPPWRMQPAPSAPWLLLSCLQRDYREPQNLAPDPKTVRRRTVRNSWPTAPVTPTTAMVGPSAVLAARTTATRERETPLDRARTASRVERPEKQPCALPRTCVCCIAAEATCN